MLSVDGIPITYDALGRMVEINNSQQPIYLAGGQKQFAQEAGSTLNGAWVSLPGGGTAFYNASGILHYGHSDWLGSARPDTSPSQTLTGDNAYAPYGEIYATEDSPGNQFTPYGNNFVIGGLDDFMFRRYHPVQGRWISPDPAGMAAADPTNPQTWDRYAYVGNNPLSYVDPLGLESPDPPPGPCDDAGPGCIILPLCASFNDCPKLNGNGGSQAPKPCLAGSGPLAAGQSRCAANNTPCKGWSFGGTISANAEIGGLPGGPLAAGTASVSAGVFNNNFSAPGGTSLAATATGGEFVGSGDMAVPNQDLTNPDAGGLYAGLGFGAFISNAGNPVAIRGHFATYTVDTPIGSAQFAKGGGIWSLSVTFGPGLVLGASKMTTNTVATPFAGSGTCVGSSSGG
jgi:RHS repeat-associated protein